MKKILLTIVAFCLTAMCLNARTIYLNTSTIDYGANGALLAIWTWGGSSDDTWSVFQNVGENLFSAEIDDDKTGGKIVRFRDIVTTPYWQAADIWNQTGDLEIPADKDMITLSQWDNETGGDWSVYTPIVPGPKVYYVVGLKDLKDWSEHEDYKLNEENKLVKSLAAGTYEFKIKEKGTWDNAINAIATSGDCNVACSHTEDDENVTFTIESVQNITIELLENKTICVSTDAVVEPEPVNMVQIYCKVPAWFASDGAAVGIHYWGNEANATAWPGIRMTAVEGETNIWTAQVPENCLNMLFLRVNPNGETSEENYIWNVRTVDTTPTEGFDMFTITNEEALWYNNNEENKCVGTWSKFTPTPPCNPGTERTIYFNRKNFDTSANGAVVAAYFFGSCQPDVWKRLAAVEGETVIDSVVITDDYTQFQLVRFANDSELEWTSTIWNRTDEYDNVNIPAENDMFVISVAESTLSGTWETFVRGQEQPIVEPEPEVPGEPRTIYIKGLGSYEATVAMWIWGENLGGKWVTFAAVEGENDIVSAEIGSNYTQCQIIRYAIGDEPSWESNYNRTEDGKDITIPGTEEDKDMLVAGYDGGNYIVGEWQKFTPTPPCNPGTERTIYFNRKNFDTSAYGAVVAAYFFGSCQPDVWKRLAAVEGETVIDSVVITDDYTQFQLVRFANDSELEWTSTIWNRTDKNDNVNIPAENDMFVISVAESTLSGTWETFVRGQEQPIVDPEPTQMRTIYCRMVYDWWYDGDAKVAIHFWKEGEDLGCQWPGQQMTKSESDSKLWSTEIPADAENCLFVRVGYNDDEYNYWGAKTDDQTLVADKDLFTFTTENAAWFSLSEGEYEPKDLCKGVWGVYDANMPTVGIGFAENSEFKVRGFAKLVASGNNIADATLQYYVKLPGNEFFSPITEQYQFLSFGSFTFKVEAIKLGTVVATATKTVNVAAAEWYVAGINDNWNDVYDMFEVAENSWQFTITLSGTHEFKLKHAGSWDGALGISAIDADCSTPGYSGTDNVKIILPSEQEVTFRTDGSTICVSIENGTFGEQEVISVYTVVGSEALIGANWDVKNTAADMLEVGENTFALTRTNVTLAAGNYNYKVVGNHQYASWQFPQAGDQTLEIADAGTYNVTFTLILGEEISLTANATKTIVTALESVENIVIFAENGRIFTAENARIYDMLGRDVTRNNGNLHGVYVVKTENVATKIVVR